MDDNVEKILGGLAVAAVSAITFVAYKHPEAYRKLLTVLSVAIAAIWIFIAGWELAGFEISLAVFRSDGIASGKVDEVSAAMSAYMIPGWCMIALVAISAYSSILATLPNWLLEKPKPNSENENK